MAKNSLTGRAYYDKIISLIDYRGDIKRKKTSEYFQGYSPDFSPNNIKRLVISPEGAIVQLHIAIQGVKTVNYVILQPNIYNIISTMEDYIPMLNCLSEDRICASIEEVIIIPSSTSGAVQLNYVEQNVSGLIKNFRDNGEKDVLELISNRYKRLRDFCIVSSNFKTVLDYINKNRDSFVCDAEELEVESVTFIHKDDWYNNYGSSASFYLLDAKDGKLNKHFQQIRDSYIEKEEYEKLEKFKKERIKGIEAKQANMLDIYLFMYKAERMLYYFAIKCPSGIIETGLLNTNKIEPEKVNLNKAGNLKKSNFYELKENQQASEKSGIEENINNLKTSVQKMYLNIVGYVLSNLEALPDEVLKIVMQDCEKSVKIPKSLEDINQNLSAHSGVAERFEGVNLKNSILNICTLYTNIFVSDITDNKKASKYLDKSAWKKELGGV